MDTNGTRAPTAAIHAKIIEVATGEFGSKGVEASLNEIAKKAGVGPGTLYRHFPTRESLIDACMQDWEAGLQAAARRALHADTPPEEMLPAWLDDFATHISYFRGGPARLLRALNHREASWMRRWDIVRRANQLILDRLAEAGALSPGTDPEQVTILACAVAAAAEDAGLSRRQRRELFQTASTGVLRR
jgi:AcrR family transcriptional regulator